MRYMMVWLALASGVLLGCGEGPVLDGSLADEMDLTYERSTLEMLPGSLSLRFLRARGTQWDTPLKLSVNVSNPPTLQGPMTLDLAEVLDGGIQRGSVTRNVYQDEHTTFPPILYGTFSLTASPGANTVAGRISITFEPGADFASGRAVFGPFAAEVVTQ